MPNDYYNHGGYPATGSAGSSATARAEFDAVMAGFAKLPTLAASALQLVRVNAGATALESTNLIDGISIGSVTPAAGAFTTLSASGNVSLGDAVADTLSVAGATVKNATNNWTLAAATSGITLQVDALDGNRSAQFAALAGANKPRIEISHTEATGLTILNFNSSTGTRAGRISIGGTAALDLSGNGNFTIAAPASGTSLTLNVLASTVGVALTDGTVTGNIGTITGTSTFWGTASNHGLQIRTNNTDRINISNAGNVTLNAPSSGGHTSSANLTINASNGSALILNSTNVAWFQMDANVASASFGSFRVGGVTRGYIGCDGGGIVGGGTGTTFGIRSDDDLILMSEGTERVRLNGSSVSLPTGGASIDFTSNGATQSQINSYNSNALELVTRHASASITFYSGNATLALTLGTNQYATFAKGVSTTTNTQAFSATPTFNASQSNYFEMGAMTANVTSVTISNPTGGQTITIRFKQDGTGGRTVAAPAGAKITGAVGATASASSFLTLTYSTADSRWEGSWLNLPA